MRKIGYITGILLLCFHVFADVNVDLSSVVSFNSRDGELEYGVLKSKICFCSSFSDNVKLHSSILVRFSPTVSSVSNISKYLEEIVYSSIYRFDLYEAYLSVDNIFLDGFNLIIGKQRIFWGKGDKINPTDVLDPFDLYGLLEFSEKMPSWSLNARLFLPLFDESYLQFVWKPFFESARLSTVIFGTYSQEIRERIVSQGKMFANVVYFGDVFGDVEKVNDSFTNSSVGFKFGARVSGFDFSISFVDRINDIPFVKKVRVSNTVRMIPSVETNLYIDRVNYNLGYYREKIVGFDISKDFEFLLLRGEVGVFVPQEIYRDYENITTFIVYTPSLTNTNYLYNVSSEEYLKSVYVKYLVGLERSFEGWYFNFQYAHGLGIERGFKEEKLQDYLVLSLEKKFLNDTLKFRLVGMLNFDDLYGRLSDFSRLIENSGVLGLFEVSYYPVIGLKLFLSISGIDGNGLSMLSRFKDFDMISMGFSLEM